LARLCGRQCDFQIHGEAGASGELDWGASKLNLPMRPRNRSFKRGCVTPRRPAASIWAMSHAPTASLIAIIKRERSFMFPLPSEFPAAHPTRFQITPWSSRPLAKFFPQPRRRQIRIPFAVCRVFYWDRHSLQLIPRLPPGICRKLRSSSSELLSKTMGFTGILYDYTFNEMGIGV